jgi:hypothetical protein
LHQSVDVEAGARDHQPIPEFFPWATDEDIESHIDRIKYKRSYDHRVNGDEHAHVRSATGHENA